VRKRHLIVEEATPLYVAGGNTVPPTISRMRLVMNYRSDLASTTAAVNPTISGSDVDLSGLAAAAAAPDGSFVLANGKGSLFLLSTDASTLTRIPDDNMVATGAVKVIYAGTRLLEVDSAGVVFSVDADSASPTFGKRTLVSAADPELTLREAGGMLALSQTDLVISSGRDRALVVVDLSGGGRRELSGRHRGQGQDFSQPGEVVLLQNEQCLYVRDSQGLFMVDRRSGDRVVLQ
jgi:hypothetical protein